uniref:Uncharacterized protein n=1 Tax=Arundo donax TaxID=35708 RepID=A0A0A9A7Z4_ARUDO
MQFMHALISYGKCMTHRWTRNYTSEYWTRKSY